MLEAFNARKGAASYLDAMSPCVVFNNHQEEWKELVTDVSPDHDAADKVAAFDLALKGGFKLGILYREQRATLNDKYKALVDAAKDSNVEQMLEAFNARKGAAIGKPTV